MFTQFSYAIREPLKKSLERLFTRAVSDKVTPGGIVGVSVLNSKEECHSFTYSFGRTEYGDGEKSLLVTKDTYYDLASLTKPLVTALCLMKMVNDGILDLKSNLVDLLPHLNVPDEKKNISLRQLMSHSSGLPPHLPFFIDALSLSLERRKEFIMESILSEKLIYAPGKENMYSDLGYILLGAAIEQITGSPLSMVFRDFLISVGIDENILIFNPSTTVRRDSVFAPTEICPWTHEKLRGVVHDDNCRVMGGEAGHAGLFGTIAGVMSLSNLISNIWRGEKLAPLPFSAKTIRNFLRKINETTWTCGFDTPSEKGSSSGNYFSPNSIGHLGFTGTSLWLDLEKGISVVFLSNRVYPTRNNIKIRRLRPEFHNIIMESVLQKKP